MSQCSAKEKRSILSQEKRATVVYGDRGKGSSRQSGRFRHGSAKQKEGNVGARCVLGVRGNPVISANKEFKAWSHSGPERGWVGDPWAEVVAGERERKAGKKQVPEVKS